MADGYNMGVYMIAKPRGVTYLYERSPQPPHTLASGPLRLVPPHPFRKNAFLPPSRPLVLPLSFPLSPLPLDLLILMTTF